MAKKAAVIDLAVLWDRPSQVEFVVRLFIIFDISSRLANQCFYYHLWL